MTTRRSFLRLGLHSALGAAVGAAVLRGRARGEPGPGDGSSAPPSGSRTAPSAASPPRTAPRPAPSARACILLYMAGGPSQLDTIDPKPGVDDGGEAIGTAVAGLQLSANLPLLAARAKHLAIVRSLASREGNHQRALHLMHTGYAPAGGVMYPALGAIVDAEIARGPMPGYVSIGGGGAGLGADAGFLGAVHAPFLVADPSAPVRNLGPARGVSEARSDARIALWRQLDDEFEKSHGEAVRERRAVTERAIAMMRSARAVAFDIHREPAAVLARYGPDRFARGCVMARRLVEAGVPFVEVVLRGWDTHEDNARRVAPLCARLDRGMSALIEDLDARGLLDSTLLVWTGEFGRTPWLNARAGRDHFPAVTPAMLAGGGVRGGQAIGATDPSGRHIASDPLSVPDLFRTIAVALGLDPDRERVSRAGRPIATVDGGAVIPNALR